MEFDEQGPQVTVSSPVVFVTGASRGIGAATAIAFAKAGWRVAIAARTLHQQQTQNHQLRYADGQLLRGSLTDTAQAIEACGAQVLMQSMDLMDAKSMDAAIDHALQHFGRIDVLINNAVYQDREVNAMLLDLDDDALQRSLVGNVVAPFHLAKKVLPHMISQGGGKIINVGSGAGQYDPPMAANQGGWGFAYGASKAGMGRLAGCINREWGHKGILAFSVNPGFVNTEAAQATLGLDAELSKKYGATTPEAIAASLLWLVSDASAAELTQKPNLIDLQALIKTKALTY
jgi:NAD(P)-dependent dehydrogenase (short-subunit alcohol dehydrogenase family)